MNNINKRLEILASGILCSGSCKRVQELTDNDEIGCKYGLVPLIDGSKPKCKYFKRHPKYMTVKGQHKIVTHYKNGKTTKERYKRGKFIITH